MKRRRAVPDASSASTNRQQLPITRKPHLRQKGFLAWEVPLRSVAPEHWIMLLIFVAALANAAVALIAL